LRRGDAAGTENEAPDRPSAVRVPIAGKFFQEDSSQRKSEKGASGTCYLSDGTQHLQSPRQLSIEKACARKQNGFDGAGGHCQWRASRGWLPRPCFPSWKRARRYRPTPGSTNIRAIVHLPLLLPGRCRFRVGNVTRKWRMNEAWVFDDTIEHQAWNESSELRVILIFDVWNPHLSEAERALVTEMLRARNEFQAMDTAPGAE